MTDVKGESGEKKLSPDMRERKRETGAAAEQAKPAPFSSHEGGAQASAHFSIQPVAGFPSHVHVSGPDEGHVSYPPDLELPTHYAETMAVETPRPPDFSSQAVHGDVNPLEKLAEIVASERKNEVPTVDVQPRPVQLDAADRVLPHRTPAPEVPSAPAVNVQPIPVQIDTADRLLSPQASVTEAPVKTGFWARRRERRAQLAALAKAPRTAHERRWARRRRRLWFEELLGWIFVPIILIALYWAVIGIFAIMGTTPEAVISGIRQILSHR